MCRDVVHNAQRAFIVVFPGSLEGLWFPWVTQMYEEYC
jgi:hypothetical protein